MTHRREIVFRCDGGRRIGAGHVARSLRIGLAFRAAGWSVRFAGDYDGVARALLEAADIETHPATDDLLALEPRESPVVVDSYELPSDEIEALAQVRPVAFVADHDPCPRVAAVLSYHLDSPQRLNVPAGTAALLGPVYAPADPRCVAARRNRGLERLLVALGGGHHGDRLLARVLEQLSEWPDPEVFVAGVDVVPDVGLRVASGVVRGGLADRIRWADVAISGSGSTPYDLACAGVPAVAAAVAENQLPIAQAFSSAGIAAGLDATGDPGDAELDRALAKLTDEATRRTMATAGPAVVDGYGSFRARDALAAVFAGGAPPPVYSYPPDPAGGIELHGEDGRVGRVAVSSDGVMGATLDERAGERDIAAALAGAAELMLAAYPSLDALHARPEPEQRSLYEAAGFHAEAGRPLRRDRRSEGARKT